MTDLMEDIIDQVIKREGGAIATNRPSDPGGRTQYGISERANPEAWADNKVTLDEAREIYLQKYVKWPKFDKIPPSHQAIQTQLIDFGVNSGPMVAIQKLQAVLGVPVDGVLGPKTLESLTAADPRSINNLLMVERLKLIARIVKKNPAQIDSLVGFVNRCVEFLV